MKTIKVTDEMYEKLSEISREIKNQDNRATAKPYFFQVRKDVKIWDSSHDREHRMYRHDDAEFEATPEGLKEICDFFGMMPPVGIDNMYYAEIDRWLESHPKIYVDRCSYDIGHEYVNAFFTEKACKEHIRRNHYHYSNPADYLQHAFRNPEMELIFEFFEAFIDQDELVKA